jgi:hypothetical protein
MPLRQRGRPYRARDGRLSIRRNTLDGWESVAYKLVLRHLLANFGDVEICVQQ